MRIGKNLDTKSYGIATPRGSDLREPINIAILELIETGFIAQLKQKWYYEPAQCFNEVKKDSKQKMELGMAQMAGIFYILIFGLCLGIFIAFLEFLFKAKLDSNRLNENMCTVIRRNLRTSIIGSELKDNERAMNHWPMQQPLSNTNVDTTSAKCETKEAGYQP